MTRGYTPAGQGYPFQFPLLDNEAASGTAVVVRGGGYVWRVEGTFGGTTVTLQKRDYADANWVTMTDIYGASCSLTAAGEFNVIVGNGTKVRATVSGGAPSALYSQLRGYGSPAASPLTTSTATLTSGDLHIGQVGGEGAQFSITPTLDTSIYASGDVLFDTVSIGNLARKNDFTGLIQMIRVNDEDDQKAAMDLVFFHTTQTLGTINAAASISDASARDILGVVPIVAGDYIDLGGVSVATLRNVGLWFRPTTGARTVYVGAITRGTPTHTASGIRLVISAILD